MSLPPLVNFAGHFACLVGLLGVAGLAGWFVIAPFQDRVRYAPLLAPLAGILVLSLGTLAFYVVAMLPFPRAALAALAVTLALGAVAAWCWARPGANWRAALVPAGVALAVAAAAAGLLNTASIRTGGVAMLYLDGSDHLGYAHVADWITAHPVRQAPATDAAAPYQSWPALMLQIDPRGSSYSYLALVALALGQPGTFAWDDALALLYAAAVLAVAGVFARSPGALGLLAAGLFTSHWFDYTRCGFLGKSLGYPSALLVTGLFIAAAGRRITSWRLVALVLLAAATALTHSGFATALFVALGGGCFLAAHWGWGTPEERAAVGDNAVALAVLSGVAVLSGGTLARPLALAFPDWNLTWTYELPRLADLENQGVQISGFTVAGMAALTWLHLGLWLAAIGVAVRQRSAAAAALLVGPILLLAALYALDARPAAFQMIGVFYPFALCGLAALLAAPGGSWRAPRYQALAIALIVIGAHQFRFSGAVSRYAGAGVPEGARYTRAEMDAITALVGSDPVDVEVDRPQETIAVMTEFGRRGLNLQWSPASWRMALGYRKDWAPPHYPQRGRWRLVQAEGATAPESAVAYRGPHYLVLRPGP